MNTCPKCGNTVAEGKMFCSACGERLTPPPPVRMHVPPSGPPRYRKETPGNSKGNTVLYTVAGIVVSLLLLAAVLLPVISKARATAREKELEAARMEEYPKICTSNQRQIALSIQIYCQENNETLPDSLAQVQDSPLPKYFQCPSATTPNSYGYNQTLVRKPLRMIDAPATTMLTADSAKQFMTSPSDIDITRHQRGYLAAFVDGHIEFRSK